MRLAISLANFVLAASVLASLPGQSQDNPPGKAPEARGPLAVTPQAPLSAKAGPAASAGAERMAPDAAGNQAIPAKPGSPEVEHDGSSSSGPEGAAPVPEPSSLLLVGTGLVGLVLTSTLRRRQRRHS